MVRILVGRKGSGKTKKMIELANSSLDNVNGNVVFINKNHRLMYDLKYRIRVVCMEEFPRVTNIDELIGFIYGILSQDHDIETVFIDSIMKLGDVKIDDLKDFLERLQDISENYGPSFTVSISAEIEDLGDYINNYEILSH